jgi:hypothetical protein
MLPKAFEDDPSLPWKKRFERLKAHHDATIKALEEEMQAARVPEHRVKGRPYLHVHGQEGPHADAWLVGTRRGLFDLRAAIDQALSWGRGSTGPLAADLEQYALIVVRIDRDEDFDNAWIPYTAQATYGVATDWQKQWHPFDKLPEGVYKAIHACIRPAE